jgi:hypothetical protein
MSMRCVVLPKPVRGGDGGGMARVPSEVDTKKSPRRAAVAASAAVAATLAQVPWAHRGSTASLSLSSSSSSRETKDIASGDDSDPELRDEQVGDERPNSEDELGADSSEDDYSGDDADADDSDDESASDGESETKGEKKDDTKRESSKKRVASARERKAKKARVEPKPVVIDAHKHVFRRWEVNTPSPWMCHVCDKDVAPIAWFCCHKEKHLCCPYVECEPCHAKKLNKRKQKEEAAAAVEKEWSGPREPVLPLESKAPKPEPKPKLPHDPLKLFLRFVPLSLIKIIVTNTNKCANNPRHKRQVSLISIPFSIRILHFTHMEKFCFRMNSEAHSLHPHHLILHTMRMN